MTCDELPLQIHIQKGHSVLSAASGSHLGCSERTTVRHRRGVEAWLAESATRQRVGESDLLSIRRTGLCPKAERSAIYGNPEVFCVSS